MFLPSAAIHPSDAKAKGYRPLTVAFFLPGERAMLDKAQRDLKGIDFCLVGPQGAPEIWRRNMMSLTESAAIKIPHDPIASRRLTV